MTAGDTYNWPAKFLFRYCVRDTLRLRELPDFLIRLFIIASLFTFLLAAAVLYACFPRLAAKIIENNRLLRLVELESTGSFPISPEKQKHLASLTETRGRIEATAEMATASRPLVAGVSPTLWSSLLFYRSDGKLSTRWKEARIVYPGRHPELPRGDQIFGFWGIRPFKPLRADQVPRILVTSKLLEELGFNATEFGSWIERGDSRGCLHAQQGDDRVAVLPVDRIDSFPDQAVQILIPARLAQMIEVQDPRIVVKKYVKYELAPARDNVKEQLQKIADKVNKDRKDKERIKLELAPSIMSVHPSAIRCECINGLERSVWQAVRKQIEEVLGCPMETECAYKEAVSGPLVDERWIAPLGAHMATLFVTDYTDIPDILSYIDRHPELKVRVLNATNLEFVRTILLSISFGKEILLTVSAIFLLSCLMGIAYSFIALVQKKIGELGILRAFGSTRAFVLSRFCVEILGVCVTGALFAWCALEWWILPRINGHLHALSSVFRDEGLMLRCGSESLYVAVGTWVLVTLVVVLVIWTRIGQCPSKLLSMNE